MQSLANKTSASLAKTVTDQSASKAAPQDKKVTAGQELTGKPTPPAVFKNSNGTRLESSHSNETTAENLTLQEGATGAHHPTRAPHRKATVAENQKRGIDLKIPTSQSQITLSF